MTKCKAVITALLLLLFVGSMPAASGIVITHGNTEIIIKKIHRKPHKRRHRHHRHHKRIVGLPTHTATAHSTRKN